MAAVDVDAAVKAALATLGNAPDALLLRYEEEIAALAVRAKAGNALAGAAKAIDTVPEDPRLISYKTHYDRWSGADKDRCSWAEVKARLSANGNEDLNRAEAMPEGTKGILFGVDSQGNPLIANGGLGPILTNMNYPDSRDAVRFTKKGGERVPTGYEMLSEEDEIRAFEASTDNPVVRLPEGFVPSDEDSGWRGIWRESGDNPVWARFAFVRPGYGRADLCGRDPSGRDPGRGVRCLLRVLKKS